MTTVRQRANRMVEETVKALLAQIENFDTSATQTVAIEAPLIVRASARIPEGWKDK